MISIENGEIQAIPDIEDHTNREKKRMTVNGSSLFMIPDGSEHTPYGEAPHPLPLTQYSLETGEKVKEFNEPPVI